MNYSPQICGECFVFSPQRNKLSKLVLFVRPLYHWLYYLHCCNPFLIYLSDGFCLAQSLPKMYIVGLGYFCGGVSELFFEGKRKMGKVFKACFVAGFNRFYFPFGNLIVGQFQSFLSKPFLGRGVKGSFEVTLESG